MTVMIAFICMDCNINTRDIDEYYMLKNKLWNKNVPEDKGMLCIGCIEKRMKRKLTSKDFIHCLLNNEDYEGKSERLLNRMKALK